MGYDYDALYQTTPNALGLPTKVLVDFFAPLAGQQMRVLDIGCGQGRDALFIARAGHNVVGVDMSSNGIKDLTTAAEAEDLDVTGIVADITAFVPQGLFDVVLIDRVLHMLDEASRLDVLNRLLDHVTTGGYCLIADERSNMPGFKQIAKAHEAGWHPVLDKKGFLFLQKAVC